MSDVMVADVGLEALAELARQIRDRMQRSPMLRARAMLHEPCGVLAPAICRCGEPAPFCTACWATVCDCQGGDA